MHKVRGLFTTLGYCCFLFSTFIFRFGKEVIILMFYYDINYKIINM